MNLFVGDDESEDEREEGSTNTDAVEEELNLEEVNLFRSISSIEKIPMFNIPTFLRNLNLEELISCDESQFESILMPYFDPFHVPLYSLPCFISILIHLILPFCVAYGLIYVSSI